MNTIASKKWLLRLPLFAGLLAGCGATVLPLVAEPGCAGALAVWHLGAGGGR
ncbi:hypothetical protein [Haliea sp.]